MAQVTSRLGQIRSLLATDPLTIDKADAPRHGPADALLVDLVGRPGDKRGARLARWGGVAAFIKRVRSRAYRPVILIRIASLDEGWADDDLDLVMPAQPDGIVLAGCPDGAAVQQLGLKLGVREATLGLADGATAIVAEAGASASGLLALPSFRDASPRLAALCWDAGALAGDLGGAPGLFVEEDGAQTVARTLLALGARAARVPAFDTATPAQGDALARESAAAKRLGFAGKLARDAGQLSIINAVFGQPATARALPA